jgi:hypothetical protein
MYYYVYQITNLSNGKIYVGKHKSAKHPFENGYFGSGKQITAAIKKYGVDNFKKEVLCYCNDAHEMAVKESEIVTEDFVKRSDTYNMHKGGYGGFEHINNDPVKRKEVTRLSAIRNKELGLGGTKNWTEKSIVKSNMRNSYEKAFAEFTSSFDSTLQNNNFGKALDGIWHQYLNPEIVSHLINEEYVLETPQNFVLSSENLPAYEIDLQIESGQIHYAIKCNKLSEFQASELRFKISLALSKHTEFQKNNFTVSLLNIKNSTIVIKADIPTDESSVSTMVKFLEEVLEKSKFPG